MEEDFAAVQRIDTAPPPVQPKASTSTQPARTITSSSLSKLEPFLLLARSARGAGAAALIDKVLDASGVYTFTELLELKSIQDLQESEYRSRLLLLQIFAYGTLKDYRDHVATLPPLNKAQLMKLRQLTIVDLASKSRSLPYSQLLSTLELSSVRELEEIIVECIYSDLILGRIDQKQQILQIDHIILGRDVIVSTTGDGNALSMGQDKTIGQIMAKLNSWYVQVGDTLQQLDANIQKIHEKEAYDAEAERQQTDRIYKVFMDTQKKDSMTSLGTYQQQMQAAMAASVANVGVPPDDTMELDERVRRSPGKSHRKRTRP